MPITRENLLAAAEGNFDFMKTATQVAPIDVAPVEMPVAEVIETPIESAVSVPAVSTAHAEAILQIAADVAINNEPIQRQEGNVEQADLNKEVIEDCKDALAILQNKSEMISMEADAGLDSLKSSIARLPELFKRLTTFLGSKINQKTMTESFYQGKLKGPSRRMPQYPELINVTVFKAPGSTVTALKLTETLFAAYKNVIEPFVNNTILNIDKYTAKLVNDPSELKSHRPIDLISKADKAQLEKSISDLTSCFDPKDTTAEATFKSQYERNQDFDTNIKLIEELNHLSFKVSGKELLKRVESVSLAVGHIVDKIEFNAPGYEFSPTTVKSLSELCFVTATFVEFYSVYMYKFREQTTAVKDTVEKIDLLK